MSKEESGGFAKAVVELLKFLFENIDSPYVWMPLILFLLFILAYPITQFQLFLYFALGFALLALAVDWAGRFQNRRTPNPPNPKQPDYRDRIFRHLASVQAKAVAMLEKGKRYAARDIVHKNLKEVDNALKEFPKDADFQALMGYTLKDMYQSSKNLLSNKHRQAYLHRALESFNKALKLDPNNASAHNGMGNVLFFQGHFDKAIEEHKKAIELTNGNYDAAKHDMDLVKRVKNGEIPFDRF